MSRITQVKMVEPQSEEITTNVDITSAEAEALLYKYSPEAFKQQELAKKQKQQPHQPQQPKRFNADDDYKPQGDYYDVKYASIDLEGEPYQNEINIKIEIKSDMNLG